MYVRYGFHIYFMNIRLDSSEKEVLKELLLKDESFKYFFEEEILPIYKTAEFYKYFDTSPFTGSTSLPLTFSERNKEYNKFVMYNGKVKKVLDCPELVKKLDPFNGKDVIIESNHLSEIKTSTLE